MGRALALLHGDPGRDREVEALAAQALASSNDAVARVTERVGYDSEAAFNRAFRREFGIPPAAWRRSVRATRMRGNVDTGE